VVYTCPSGNCGELIGRTMPHRRGHVHKFLMDDIKSVWGTKAYWSADYLAAGWTSRGLPIGNWLIAYQYQPGRPCGDRPLQDRIRRTRPQQTLSVGMIVKDAATDLGRCLTSIWPIADEIVVGDTGSTDETRAIAESYGARVLDLDPIDQQPAGFAGARNAVLQACAGQWFLWIDADEQLVGGMALRRYLDGPLFLGYVIHQNHLQLDGPMHHDIPVRLFRRTPEIQFYGCVHEQPQYRDCNGDIHPTLDATDVQIAHLGYLTEQIRMGKMTRRNRPLLLQDQRVFPDRTLGKVLLIREAVQQSAQVTQMHGSLTPDAQAGYVYAVRLFRDRFLDPAHKLHKLARPYYEVALQALGIGWEVELALAGKRGGLGISSAKPERVWVADAAELELILAHRARQTTEAMTPVVFHTEPFATATEAVAV
jgi:glycosyltransferase involved in cell wall biosynthesis